MVMNDYDTNMKNKVGMYDENMGFIRYAGLDMPHITAVYKFASKLD